MKGKKLWSIFILITAGVFLMFTGCPTEEDDGYDEVTLQAQYAMGEVWNAMGPEYDLLIEDVTLASDGAYSYENSAVTVNVTGTVSDSGTTIALNITFTDLTDGTVTLNGNLTMDITIEPGATQTTMTMVQVGSVSVTGGVASTVSVNMTYTEVTNNSDGSVVSDSYSGSVTIDGSTYRASELLAGL